MRDTRSYLSGRHADLALFVRSVGLHTVSFRGHLKIVSEINRFPGVGSISLNRHWLTGGLPICVRWIRMVEMLGALGIRDLTMHVTFIYDGVLLFPMNEYEETYFCTKITYRDHCTWTYQIKRSTAMPNDNVPTLSNYIKNHGFYQLVPRFVDPEQFASLSNVYFSNVVAIN